MHKKATNFGVLSELGRTSMHYDIIKNMVNYWHRLENLDSSSNFILLKHAFINSQKIFNERKPSWYGSIQYLLRSIDKINEFKFSSTQTFKNNSKKIIHNHFIDLWHIERIKISKGKLDTYSFLKTNFGLEKYLLILKNNESRRNITKLRISAHKLNIEKGRYQGIPREERKCTRCNLGELDDERHLLISCNHTKDLRTCLFASAKSYCKNFTSLNLDNQFLWLMNNENINILSLISDIIKFSNV